MVKKSNFLKNLLTTASVLAVTASAGTAMAQDMQNLVGTNAAIANGVVSANTATVAAPAAPANFTNGDNFRFSSANNLTTGGIVTIGTINLNNFAAGPFTVANNVDLASVVNTTGVQKLATTVADGKTLKLTGANVSALGAITLGSGGGVGTLDVTANDTTLTGNIDSKAGANAGVITINATNTVFEGSVGATTKLRQLDIKDGKSAKLAKTGNNKIDDVQIDTGSTLTIGAGVNITSTKIDGVVNNKGTLAFEGASTVAVTTIGNNANTALEAITIGNGLVDFSTTTDLKATKTTLNGANSAIKFTAATNSTTDFETATNDQGKVTFNVNHTTKGNFGADGLALNTVEVIDTKTLTNQKDAGKLYVNNVTATGNGTATLALKGANYEIHANIGTEANKFLAVSLQGDVANAATTFKLMAGKTIHSTTVDLANANNVDNTLELHEGSSIIGNVDTANANRGFLSVKGDATVSSIGATNAINQVKFDEAKILTVTENTVNANAGINFIKDGTLALTKAAALDITQDVIVAKSDANGLGSITVNNATAGQLVKFAQIGDVAVADTSLKLLAATGGANVELNGTASIIKLDLGSSNAEVRLTNAGKYLIKDLAHAQGKASLVLGAAVTLKEGTNLGNALDYIQINNHALTVENGVN